MPNDETIESYGILEKVYRVSKENNLSYDIFFYKFVLNIFQLINVSNVITESDKKTKLKIRSHEGAVQIF